MNSDYISKFYEQYSKEVYLYTFSLCKNSHLAEDIMQEAFVRAILYLDDNHYNIKFWLFRVCRNLYIDYVRKNKIISQLDILDLHIEDTSLDVLKGIIKSESSLNLYNKVMSLPNTMKEVIVLFYYLEIPQNKIANIMNISNGAVRTLIYRARKHLRSIMEE